MNISQSITLSNPELLSPEEGVKLLVHIQEDYEKFLKDNGGKEEILKDMDLTREYINLRNLSNVAKVAMLINKEILDENYLII